MKFSTLTLSQLEDRARKLLGEYAETIGGEVPSPVPVTDIAENELGLKVEFQDLHAYLGRPKRGNFVDILGVIEFSRDWILIDNTLHPDVFPHRLGRFRFSVAHEIGHWRMHKTKVLESQKLTNQAAIICRDPGSGNLPKEEWQAENFASFLLLPRERVLDAWGGKPPVTFDVQRAGSRELRSLWSSLTADPQVTRSLFARECEKHFEQFAAPLAYTFDVSNMAMAVRLERMGLLRRSAIGLKVSGPNRGDFLHTPMPSGE